MALFVDGPACTIDDLSAQDAGLLGAAQSEGINVNTKIQLAMEEMLPELQLWIDRPRPAVYLPWQPVWRIEQILVTREIKRWQVMTALSLFYRDAYFSQLVDRYQAKWDEYTKQARIAREYMVGAGLAMVANPVRKAPIPVLGTVPGSQAGGQFYAAVGYLNALGQEGQGSDAAAITIADGNVMTVQPADAPAAWNVYAGTTLDGMYLQNPEPLGAGDVWTFVPGAVASGPTPSTGQMPEMIMPLVRSWLRG